MEDDYLLDSHKLMFHTKTLSKWLDGADVYPIEVEISLTNNCNHNCIYCAPNFFRKDNIKYIDTDIIKKALGEMAKVGVKSICVSGEGEPLLHEDIVEIIEHAKSKGLDIGMSTNGVLFNMENIKRIIHNLSWCRFSLDTGISKIYSQIHRTSPYDAPITLTNISKASWWKRLKSIDCTVGAQAIALKQNIGDLHELAKYLSKVKVDYLVIKPFSEMDSRLGDTIELPTNKEVEDAVMKCKEFENKIFKVIYRENAFNNLNEEKPYEECYGREFMAHIDVYGNIYSCINHIGNKILSYGNIYEDSFENIWNKRHDIKINVNKCRQICRLDNMNRYLWKLKNPPKHVNFI